MKLALIAARGSDGVIGVNNQLPWHLPADLKKFKALTMGAPIIMGRKTHESIGRALPGRLNIVISRHAGNWQGCQQAGSLEAALQLATEAATEAAPEIFIIGGGEIYRQALPLAQRLYITEVATTTTAGDTFFPEIDLTQWQEIEREAYVATATTPAYAFVVYQRQ
ncbi:MAG: dihydrofolate reductase [Proteobacteria bacterium]|nr:dihydrofolate reductase [Pseudomonadota bacterium]MCH9759016.1 dihydrofolate reductase [Pseudomonadota bacterium]